MPLEFGNGDRLAFMQLALCSSDMAGTCRLYSEAFGFVNSGANAAWGDVMQIEGLDPSARSLVWWMVGRQRFVQFEIFHHTKPAQRPLRADWRPCDHGWIRFGVSVPHLDATLGVFEKWHIPLLSAPAAINGVRSAAIRDPFCGCVIEVMEESPHLPGGIRRQEFPVEPAIVYVTSSVSDIAAAEHFYRGILDLEIMPLETLHAPDHEALWGLAGASREGFAVDGGGTFLEIVQYTDPVGRPMPADYRLSDQGVMNVGLGSEKNVLVQNVLDRLEKEGRAPRGLVRAPDILGTYILDREREVELFSCPKALETSLGLTPALNFFGASDNAVAGLKVEIRP